MSNDQQISSLEDLLQQIDKTAKSREEVSIESILQVAGRKSFGTLLLLAGIITLAPLVGDIPGVPTLMGMIVFLIAIQLLLNRKELWLPRFLLMRSIQSTRLQNSLDKLYTPAQFIDRYLKPRLTILTRGFMIYLIAFICLGIAVVMPVMEIIPFSANLAGLALTAFGLSLIARDGYLTAFALLITAGIVVGALYRFM